MNNSYLSPQYTEISEFIKDALQFFRWDYSCPLSLHRTSSKDGLWEVWCCWWGRHNENNKRSGEVKADSKKVSV